MKQKKRAPGLHFSDNDLEAIYDSGKNATISFMRMLIDKINQLEARIEKLEDEKLILQKEVSDKIQLENLYHSVGLASQLIEETIIEINEALTDKSNADKITSLIDYISVETN